MTTGLTCPTCGTVSYLEEVNRDAGSFCRVCDYPLFWARTRRGGSNEGAVSDAGLRRLPGTAGRVALAMMPCPVCTEPNPVTANICIRCGADLHPIPAIIVEAPLPAPVPPPPPPVVHRVVWPWIVLGCLAAMLAIVLIVMLSLD
jgi:hypothetical protein